MGGDNNAALASSGEGVVDTAKPIVNSAWKLPIRSGAAFRAGPGQGAGVISAPFQSSRVASPDVNLPLHFVLTTDYGEIALDTILTYGLTHT